ncbi:hypothetical protein ES703_42369 [subsurface metagenome]
MNMKKIAKKALEPGGRICQGGNRLVAVMAAMVLCLLGIATTDIGAQPPAISEYDVKVAFLYKFAKFVEWPAESFSGAGKTLRLCVADTDLTDDVFETVKSSTVRGRELVIKECRGPEDLESCHILFVTRSREQDLAEIMAAATHYHVLTIGETEGFTELGGIINFIMVEKKVRFEINVDAARRAGLKISSKLLRLAKIVKEKH